MLTKFVFLILYFFVDMRLIGGSTPFDGIVEVQIAGVWQRVCQMGWSYQMAEHVCHQIGKILQKGTDH